MEAGNLIFEGSKREASKKIYIEGHFKAHRWNLPEVPMYKERYSIWP